MRILAFLVPAVLIAALLAGLWAPVEEPQGLTVGRRPGGPDNLTLRPGEGTPEAVGFRLHPRRRLRRPRPRPTSRWSSVRPYAAFRAIRKRAR